MFREFATWTAYGLCLQYVWQEKK